MKCTRVYKLSQSGSDLGCHKLVVGSKVMAKSLRRYAEARSSADKKIFDTIRRTPIWCTSARSSGRARIETCNHRVVSVEHMGLGGRFGGLSVMRIARIVFVVVLVSERPETKKWTVWLS